MKANDTLSVEDVRKICKRLVSTKGDVVSVSQETSTPVGLIIRIKEKKIFKAISDSYFDETTFGDVPKGVREPERVSIIPEQTETEKAEKPETESAEKVEPEKNTEPKKVEAESKNRKSGYRYSEEDLHKISKAISEGKTKSEIVKKYGVSKSTIQTIINKEAHVDISDKYFTRDGFTITSKLTGITYNLNIPRGGKKSLKTTSVVTPNTTTTTTATTDTTDTKTNTTSNLVSEIRELGVQILMNSKVNDLPDDIKAQVKEIIENNIDNMSLRDISKLGG
jgi:hypothetical protein